MKCVSAGNSFGHNLSLILNNYRTVAATIAEYGRAAQLHDDAKLAINHVYFFDGHASERYSGDFPCIDAELATEFGLNESFDRLSKEEVDLIGSISFNMSRNERDDAEAAIIDKLGSSQTKVCAKVLYNLLQTYTSQNNIHDVDESMYMTMAINPFIDVVFDYSCGLSKAGFFTKLEGSYNIKPDVKYSALLKQKKMDFLVFEVKAPSSAAKDDFFKLTIELQIMLNRLVSNGIDDPVVFGVLNYGFECDVYKMDLKAPAIYRLVKIRSCYVPRSSNDFGVVANSITTLKQLRVLVLREVERAKTCTSRISKKLTWIRNPVLHYKDNE